MTSSEPAWIDLETAHFVHARTLAVSGGAEGVRDEGLLSSALERPKHRWNHAADRPSLARLAAAYAFGVVRNHPFVDGNKRTAFVLCLLFLARNGTQVEATQDEKYAIFMQLAEGRLDEEGLERWISPRLRPRTP